MEKELTKCFDISIREKRSLLVTITHSGREEARQLETSKVGVFSVYWCCWHTVWKLRKFTLTPLWQKIRETNVFTKEIAKKLI